MQLNREKLRRQLNRYVPITAWLPTYPRDLLRGDIISGVTVWGVMVPVAMAYAQMAGLPPEVGLYTAFAALLGYAIFSTSRQLKVTASSTMAGEGSTSSTSPMSPATATLCLFRCVTNETIPPS